MRRSRPAPSQPRRSQEEDRARRRGQQPHDREPGQASVVDGGHHVDGDAPQVSDRVLGLDAHVTRDEAGRHGQLVAPIGARVRRLAVGGDGCARIRLAADRRRESEREEW